MKNELVLRSNFHQKEGNCKLCFDEDLESADR